jgi:hypothetical protein
MAAGRPRTPRRVSRWLLAALTVPAVAVAGAAAWPTDPAVSTAASSTTVAGAATAAADPAADSSALLATVDAAAAAAGGSIAVVVLDADGEPLAASADADDADYTASLVKLLVVQQLLERDEAGTLALDGDDLALMARAVEASDDDAMSTLWVRYDGAGLVTDAAAEFGLTATAAPEVAGQWGESTTSAADYATFLATLDEHLSDDDLAMLTGWMQSTTSTAADGFDQDFGLLAADVGAGTVAAKQGWMCCVDAQRQLHSTGVLADGRVVVLLGDFPSSTSWPEAQAALDAAAAAVVSG